MTSTRLAVGFALALSLTGCGGQKPEAAKDEPAATLAGTAMPDEANGGTVTGKVVFAGTKPVMADLDMSANPACMRAHAAAPAKSEEVVINGNGTLKNAFVWVKSGLPRQSWAVPAKPVVLDQSGCIYKPHVLGAMAGQNIEIRNSDATNHNIHPQPRANQEWNESQPPGGDAKTKSFPREEVMISLKCNIHPWMRSYVGVVGHPFYAVTGDDGTFTIKGLPPGTYTLETWHEKFGTQNQQVTVRPKESKAVEFVYKG